MNSKKGARIQTETVIRHNLVNNKKASFFTPKFSINEAFKKAGIT